MSTVGKQIPFFDYQQRDEPDHCTQYSQMFSASELPTAPGTMLFDASQCLSLFFSPTCPFSRVFITSAGYFVAEQQLLFSFETY
jgi:hypothetical protein